MQRIDVLHPQAVVVGLGADHVEQRAPAQLLPLLQREVAQPVAVAQHQADAAQPVEGRVGLLIDLDDALATLLQHLGPLQPRGVGPLARGLGRVFQRRIEQRDVDGDARIDARGVRCATGGCHLGVAANAPAQLRLVAGLDHPRHFAQRPGVGIELADVGGPLGRGQHAGQVGHRQQQGAHALGAGQAVTRDAAQPGFDLPGLRLGLGLLQLGLLQLLAGLDQLTGAALVGLHDGLQRLHQAGHLAQLLAVDHRLHAEAAALEGQRGGGQGDLLLGRQQAQPGRLGLEAAPVDDAVAAAAVVDRLAERDTAADLQVAARRTRGAGVQLGADQRVE